MSNGSCELFPIDNEINNLSRILSVLSLTTSKERRKMFFPFDELSPGLNKDSLNSSLIDILHQSKYTGHWGYQKIINIGPSMDESQFNFFIFHEAGHALIEQSGNAFHFVNKIHSEENFCHDFSRGVCTALGLPYDKQMEIVCRQIGRLNILSRDEQIKYFDSGIFNTPIARVLNLTR